MPKYAYYELEELAEEAPKLFGVPTGTKLDEMFYRLEEENGSFVRKPLGGLPYLSILNISGIPDTGKSLFAEQFAAYQSSKGYRVLFVTVENPANFLYSAIKEKCKVLNLDFEKAKANIFIVDASEEEELRENPKELMETMAYAIKEKKITNVIIDSITGLYEHREMMARQIVRQFFNFLKKWRQTGLFISQKRSAQASESVEAAGGLAVAHIVDGTIVVDKKLIMGQREANFYKKEIGDIIRLIRIDGCRISGHDSRTWVFEITELGTIKIIAPLAEYIRRD